MDLHQKGWFTDVGSSTDKNIALSIAVQRMIHEEQSKYQKIVIFESQAFGKCLALDDAIQFSEKDEFAYQEMIAYLALESHPKPERVLIIGGGDGGVARECLRHPLVKQVTLCEIDERVVAATKKHFPRMADSFNDPRLHLVIAEGYEYLKERVIDGSFDVIITDSSDPEGPARRLYCTQYYELVAHKLSEGGIACYQAESLWLDAEFISCLMKINNNHFKQVYYASTMVCTYPTGQIGFIVCSKSSDRSLKDPINRLPEVRRQMPKFKYYSSEMHKAAFVLPKFLEEKFYPQS